MKTNFIFRSIILLFSQLVFSQVGIGTTTPDPSSELEVSSPLNDKGVLIPRMLEAERNLIASPATSLLIYQTDNTPGFYYFNGTVWVRLAAGASTDWSRLGNSGTVAATNFLGTKDDVDFVLRRNDIRAGYLGNPFGATLSTVDRRNTSFGANSLLTPATGYRNTVIGSNAMPLNDSGNRNVAIGDTALASNVSGIENTAVGVGALFNNESNNSNTAIGRNALTTSKASFNTAVGDRALTANTVGTLNTATGVNSLFKNLDGSNNTANGVQAIRANTSGLNNTAMGFQALSGNPTIATNTSTFSNNTAVGYQSLLNNLTGNDNTAIGARAGIGVTGANNIVIGANSEVAVVANSNQLSIGNVIYGKDMTSTSAGKIGIGVSNPNAKLQITSSNEVTPDITDGVLIPKVNNLLAVPTAAQQGMLVYLNIISGTNQPGFYYWDNNIPSWIGLNSTLNGDHDWYEEGTTLAPNSINDKMFHLGNVAIGKNMADYPLDILTTNNVNGIYNELNNNTNAGSKVGIINNVSDTSIDSKVGLQNNVTSNGNSLFTVGISNLVGGVGTQIYGTSNTLTGSNGTQSNLDGTRNTLSVLTGANNNVNGVYNILTPSTSGFYNGVNNLVTNSTGAGFVSGLNNQFSGNTLAENTGVSNSIGISGGADVYGIKNLLSGEGLVYGIKTTLGGAQDGNKFGAFNDINNSGNGNHYGVRNNLTGTGTGTKWGTFSTINPSAGGTHYGVYSEVLKAGVTNFAGYFLGNVGIGTTTVNTYTLPAFRSTTAGQIMQSDGLGNVTWQTPAAALNSSAWLTTGNSGMTANFIGTTDANPLIFRTSNLERMRIVPGGEVVIGNTVVTAGDRFSSYTTGFGTSVHGYSTLTGRAVQGDNSGTGLAVYGNNTGTGRAVEGDSVDVGFGVLGFNSGNGIGVFAGNTGNGESIRAINSSATSTVNTGFFGQNSTGLTTAYNNSAAIRGQSLGIRGGTFFASGASGNNTVLEGSYSGVAGNFDGFGVFGSFNSNPGWGLGVVGQGGFFGVFSIGDSGATGVKTFTIDHPKDPENKYLKHFSIESNEVLNMYRGNVILDSNGEAIVSLPDYFDEININFSYNLTSIGKKAEVYIKEEINNNQFKISGGNPNQKISWQVYGERNDLYLQKYPEKKDVEVNKKQDDKSLYLMPELYNLPQEKGILYRHKSDPSKVKIDEIKPSSEK